MRCYSKSAAIWGTASVALTHSGLRPLTRTGRSIQGSCSLRPKFTKLSAYPIIGGIMPMITPEPILKIAMGFMAPKFLFAAREIGMCEALADGPAGTDEIATRIAVPQRTTDIVVAAMVSLGLIEHEGTRYRNSAAAATFLAGKPGRDLRSYLRHSDRTNYLVWSKLSEALRHEQSQFPELNHEQQSLYSACIEEFTATAAAALATPMISVVIVGSSMWRMERVRSC